MGLKENVRGRSFWFGKFDSSYRIFQMLKPKEKKNSSDSKLYHPDQLVAADNKNFMKEVN